MFWSSLVFQCALSLLMIIYMMFTDVYLRISDLIIVAY